jgi:hypothetical protein
LPVERTAGGAYHRRCGIVGRRPGSPVIRPSNFWRSTSKARAYVLCLKRSSNANKATARAAFARADPNS